MLTLLVTVGSTSFPLLTDFIANSSNLDALHQLGITHVTLQHGSYTPTLPAPTEKPPHLEPIRYHPNLTILLRKADVVVSHAGAGTLLEAIEAEKPLVVVVNDALMNNHQSELADAMQAAGCCLVLQANSIQHRLIDALRTVLNRDDHVRSAPPRVKAVFANIVAQELSQVRNSCSRE